MNDLKEIIREEVKKLNKAVLEHINTDDDDCIICRLIVYSICLIDLYRGKVDMDYFLKCLQSEEDVKYYTNLLIPKEYEVRDS